jgi:hypothetical protein
MSNTNNVFFPYDYLDEEILITKIECSAVGIEQAGTIDVDQHRISLAKSINALDKMSLHLEMNITKNSFHKVLHQSENISNYGAILVIHCKGSRYRKGISLSLVENSENIITTADIDLNPFDFSGTASLQLFLVRLQDNSSLPNGYAKHKGDRVASSIVWEIVFGPKNKRMGEFLNVRWEAFSKSDFLPRKSNPDIVYYLDYSDSPPTLFLNEDIRYLRRSRGMTACIRNMIFDSIAQSVWNSLFLTAINNKESIEDLDNWELGILEVLMPALTDKNGQDGFLDIRTLFNDDIQAALEKLNTAIQNQLRIDKSTISILSAMGE